MNDKIVIVVPNYSWFGKRPWNTMPVALPILAAMLKGYDFTIVDANINQYSEDELLNVLKNENAGLVLLTTVSFFYHSTYHKTAEIIKQANPSCILIGGGVYVTTCIEHCMQDVNIDIGMIGRAENRLCSLIDALLRGDGISEFKGIAYRKGDEVIYNELPSTISDTMLTVKPDYSKTEIKKYVKKSSSVTSITNAASECRRRFANLTTSYGCVYNCLFCAARTITGRKIVTRPADDVLEELDFLVKDCGAEVIYIPDDHILFDKDRALYIFQEIANRKYDIEIRIENLALWHVDENIINAMRHAGCSQVTVSVESGCERVLHDIIRKPLKLENVKPVIDMCRKAGIRIRSNIVIGFPGETWNEIRESIKFVEDCNFDMITINLATPMPKTDLYTLAVKENVLINDFSFFGEYNAGLGTGHIATDEFTPQEIEILRAYEWDRINFSTKEKRDVICEMLEISADELREYRKQSRLHCGNIEHYFKK